MDRLTGEELDVLQALNMAWDEWGEPISISTIRSYGLTNIETDIFSSGQAGLHKALRSLKAKGRVEEVFKGEFVPLFDEDDIRKTTA